MNNSPENNLNNSAEFLEGVSKTVESLSPKDAWKVEFSNTEETMERDKQRLETRALMGPIEIGNNGNRTVEGKFSPDRETAKQKSHKEGKIAGTKGLAEMIGFLCGNNPVHGNELRITGATSDTPFTVGYEKYKKGNEEIINRINQVVRNEGKETPISRERDAITFRYYNPVYKNPETGELEYDDLKTGEGNKELAWARALEPLSQLSDKEIRTILREGKLIINIKVGNDRYAENSRLTNVEITNVGGFKAVPIENGFELSPQKAIFIENTAIPNPEHKNEYDKMVDMGMNSLLKYPNAKILIKGFTFIQDPTYGGSEASEWFYNNFLIQEDLIHYIKNGKRADFENEQSNISLGNIESSGFKKLFSLLDIDKIMADFPGVTDTEFKELLRRHILSINRANQIRQEIINKVKEKNSNLNETELNKLKNRIYTAGVGGKDKGKVAEMQIFMS